MIDSIYGEVTEEFMKHEIVMPTALRGLLILMMGDYDSDNASYPTFTKLIQSVYILLELDD